VFTENDHKIISLAGSDGRTAAAEDQQPLPCCTPDVGEGGGEGEERPHRCPAVGELSAEELLEIFQTGARLPNFRLSFIYSSPVPKLPAWHYGVVVAYRGHVR
jgi:hypothetical protein